MIGALRRKVRQLADDPALRRWLLERVLGRTSGAPPFTPHRPPYLDDGAFDLGTAPPVTLTEAPQPLPQGPLALTLPGATLALEPGGEAALFQDWADLETRLAVHRFAWLPLLGPSANPAWVARLFACWAERHGRPDESWAWHPYTAAERAANLLDYSRHHPLPPGAGALLAAHPPAIAARLEYFGQHYTGNHLANNGRGLYLIGLALGWERCAKLGLAILLTEAGRLFGPSGILNEQSSHYHLLLTRNYLSCQLAASRHGRPEAAQLEAIVLRGLGILPHLALPGGLPLVGDISPDCPPEFLDGLLPGGGLEQGWGAWLSGEERVAVTAMRDGAPSSDPGLLRAEGWVRGDFGPWSGLWHASPQGWPAMPGHAHQDLGAAELHWRGQPVFIDPGRGAYGETGEAARYRSAEVHGLLQVDGADPYPPNRPYYDADFRRRLGRAAPCLAKAGDVVKLSHQGFRAQGVSEAGRSWIFAGGRLEISDSLDGHGMHRITRRLVTPFPARLEEKGVMITTPVGRLLMTADAPFTLEGMTYWSAYGRAASCFAILVHTRSGLPWNGRISVTAV
ncbi:heparinase II III family protein [Paramagnetospirillum caucaseum]|uniref:Heparinase II III family protein n=1 Tax=Paramagnetospirillum caucaseum TaxID=1244869 RepID=M3ADD6_9PROT|nr:heparinase II/III family protein [Paramagnetospirillum caucaseum]EME70514.1 heparinase II III family protein [Paramagnetospirillum caucaseum]